MSLAVPLPLPTMTESLLEVDEDSTRVLIHEEGERSSFTTSASASVTAYRMENGRRYHAYKEGSYLFPNDEIENKRLDMQHTLFLKSSDGKLHLAPIPKDIENTLDIGTGTGIWAVDFADEYPSAQITGTDLSPIQPSFVPPNVTFIIDDAEADWAYPEPFDFIHGRMLGGAFQDWHKLYRQSFAHLRPGGWLELQDACLPFRCDDESMPQSSALARWSRLLIEACKRLDRPITAAQFHKERMEAAGFVDVQEVVFRWPLNTWAKGARCKEIGAWTTANTLEALQGLSMAPFTRGLGWTAKEVDRFLVDVRNDVQDRHIHSYWPIHFVFGRKPQSHKQ